MSESEYMRSVKWTTAIYSCVSAGSILIAMCGMYWGLKGDIKDNRVTSHEELTAAVVSINRKQDSLQHINNETFKDIWNIIRLPIKNSTYSAVTERYINGKLVLIPER